MPSKSAKQAKFMRAVAHSPEFAKKAGVPQKVGKEYEMADKKTKKYNSGGAAKKPMPKEGTTGGASTVPMTPERKEFLDRMKKAEAESKKGVKPNPSKYAKGGKMADKAGRALKKKSADTMGRAMMKKAGGGKCYAKGGSVSSRADGCATKGKTKGKMV